MTVKIGESNCDVIEASATQIQFKVGNAPSGSQPVTVNVNGKGKTYFTVFKVKFPFPYFIARRISKKIILKIDNLGFWGLDSRERTVKTNTSYIDNFPN